MQRIVDSLGAYQKTATINKVVGIDLLALSECASGVSRNISLQSSWAIEGGHMSSRIFFLVIKGRVFFSKISKST